MKQLDWERLRSEYPVGCRVELIQMDDPQAPSVGTIGTITGVDDIGKMNIKLQAGAKDVAEVIEQTKDRILEILRCGLISTYAKSIFLPMKFRIRTFWWSIGGSNP